MIPGEVRCYSRFVNDKTKEAREGGDTKNVRITGFFGIIEPKEQGTKGKKYSKGPSNTDFDSCGHEENARDQRAKDGKAKENERNHADCRADVVPTIAL